MRSSADCGQRRAYLALRQGLVHAALWMLAAGCASDTGSELKVRPKPHGLEAATAAPLRLPADEPFSIALAPAEKAPGLGGSATSEADADPQGRARARAEVAQGGLASGRFQLGHAFENRSPQQVDLRVVVRLEHEFSLTSAQSDGRPDAQVALSLYARDGRGRLTRDLPLVKHSSEQLNASRAASDQLDLTLTLAPGENVAVFLAGSCQIEADYRRTASAQLEVRNLKMEVTSTPAPPVRAAAEQSP